MKKYSAILAVVAASALCFSAQANPILGSIAFGGGTYTIFSGGPGLSPAATINVMNESVINPTTGSFAPLVGDAATFNNPVSLAIGPSGAELFSVFDGANTWVLWDVTTTGSGPGLPGTYNAGGVGDFVEYLGAGIGGPALATSSLGLWNFSADTAGASFAFNGTAAVPDGGLTIAMLGCVLLGFSGIRSRLGKRA